MTVEIAYIIKKKFMCWLFATDRPSCIQRFPGGGCQQGIQAAQREQDQRSCRPPRLVTTTWR